MKKQIYYFIIILLYSACATEEIETFYSQQEYLFFKNSYKDSLVYTFFYYPDSSSLTIPIEVKLVGRKTTADREFLIEVDSTTSSVLSKHYDFPEKFVFHANHVTDTIHIKINNTPDLNLQTVRLVLCIKPSSHFLPGQIDHTRQIIRFGNRATQPEWWDKKITDTYLGAYSEKKFKEFIKVTGVGDLSNHKPDEIWYLARTFKYYLQSQDQAGSPVIDEDGNKMTVTVIG